MSRKGKKKTAKRPTSATPQSGVERLAETKSTAKAASVKTAAKPVEVAEHEAREAPARAERGGPVSEARKLAAGALDGATTRVHRARARVRARVSAVKHRAESLVARARTELSSILHKRERAEPLE